MLESDLNPILEKAIELEIAIDPEIVTDDVPLVDRKKGYVSIEEEAEPLEDVEADL